MKKIIITYGTLRQGGTNHNYYLREELDKNKKPNSKFLGEGKIKGFDLYDLGSYPAIIEGEGEVVAEIYEISEEMFKGIDYMEKSAYYNPEEIIVNGIKGTIWFFKKETLKLYKNAKKIEHGDYIKFKDEEKFTDRELKGGIKRDGNRKRNN